MPGEVLSPLHDIVKRMASVSIEGPAARMKQRFIGASDDVVVLADVSGSMADLIGSSNLAKCEHLAIALQDVLVGNPRVKLIAFGSWPKVVEDLRELPDPRTGDYLGGGTNLGLALEKAAGFKPRKTIVITDGLPDSEAYAEQEAKKITGSIDTIYCGPDGHPAVQFLRRLAHDAGGVQVTFDGYREALDFSSVIRGLLT